MTRRRDMMLLDIIECNHQPMIPIVDNGVILHWLCGCGKEVPNVHEHKSVIYWFKGQGLFTGDPRNIGCANAQEVAHKADAIIENNEVTKNRYGHCVRITNEAISDLYMLSLKSQFEFFKGL